MPTISPSRTGDHTGKEIRNHSATTTPASSYPRTARRVRRRSCRHTGRQHRNRAPAHDTRLNVHSRCSAYRGIPSCRRRPAWVSTHVSRSGYRHRAGTSALNRYGAVAAVAVLFHLGGFLAYFISPSRLLTLFHTVDIGALGCGTDFPCRIGDCRPVAHHLRVSPQAALSDSVDVRCRVKNFSPKVGFSFPRPPTPTSSPPLRPF